MYISKLKGIIVRFASQSSMPGWRVSNTGLCKRPDSSGQRDPNQICGMFLSNGHGQTPVPHRVAHGCAPIIVQLLGRREDKTELPRPYAVPKIADALYRLCETTIPGLCGID
jgi:hypothetical protein